MPLNRTLPMAARLIAVWSLIILLIPARPVLASPPDTPVITSPQERDVGHQDVHMELGAPFSDPDGDRHVATDWEIRTDDGSTVVWAAYRSHELVHAHFDDGQFMGPLAGERALLNRTTYLFRVRFLDSRDEWSAWAERRFFTRAQAVNPLRQITGLLGQPRPTWRGDSAVPMTLPTGARLVVEGLDGTPFLTLASADDGLDLTLGLTAAQRQEVRLRLTAGADQGLDLPTSRLSLVTNEAERLTIYLPALRLPPAGEQVLWVSQTGATFYGTPDETHPDRRRIARDTISPWSLEPGYRLETVSGAFQLPTTLAFVPNPGTDPSAPRFYVTELYGRIKVVTNDGRIFNFAEGLLNVNPTGAFPGSGELGVIGICLDPNSRDVYATSVFRDSADSLRNRVIRLRSADGLRATELEEILAVRPGQGLARPSHQIQQCSFGPDGKLYTFMADGPAPEVAQDDRSFGGKVLRLNPDGSAPTDNPLYDRRAPTAPISYQYAKGQRNAYGMTWRPSDGKMYMTENGPDVDRIVRIDAGRNYGWDGTNESMATNALYVWPEAHWSPVGLVFVEGPNASALPADKQGRLLVASAGQVYARGVELTGKAIQEFRIRPDGSIGDPTIFARYVGEGRGSIVDLRLQSDGLYFTDLYLDDGDGGATAPGGKVWRLRYTGQAAATASAVAGEAPLAVTFTNTSTMSGRVSWDFGDGTITDASQPTHTFTTPGRHVVQLTVTAPDGTTSEQLILITVSSSLAVPAPPATERLRQGPGPDVVYYPEMGTTLGGGFKLYWEANGGLTRFGYPLTSEFRERNPSDGQVYVVQYFERARFEYHPEHKGTRYETQLGLVGVQIAGRRREPPFQRVDGAGEGALYFPETGHSLGGPFRQWWQENGGADSFGLPISEQFEELSPSDGKVYWVQFFERARFEHRPELAGTRAEMRLARLGAAVFVRRPTPRDT